jgi:hypothetical protein
MHPQETFEGLVRETWDGRYVAARACQDQRATWNDTMAAPGYVGALANINMHLIRYESGGTHASDRPSRNRPLVYTFFNRKNLTIQSKMRRAGWPNSVSPRPTPGRTPGF